jgi:hypothetical protein
MGRLGRPAVDAAVGTGWQPLVLMGISAVLLDIGAVGSMLAGIAWAWGGWPDVCAIGAAFGGAALLVDWIGGPE